MDLTSLSKFLSYVLRHHPESIGLELDDNGWADVSALINKAQAEGKPLDRGIIERIMDHGSKQRFILSEGGDYIRAGYGHSVDLDLQLKPQKPPNELYHGTARRNVDSIMEQGIKSGSRNFVHLSASQEDAQNVGSRHGSAVILLVNADMMADKGFDFYQSDSEPDIWLTKKVPPEFVEPKQ